ncbi:hypothetical protein [Nannocystis sp. SCPEA4]|uniref:hypothetical protein n=1 Tax=Nannocystis sp. SCPEA4 TaxID=2996787 RepID=UPI00226FDE13|nr:hypothetical protein [Nannocystis sp. SCPEA4]MCY1056342.1 hypothetical protein [Nannocystis sp. SCPEA4]
MRNADETAKREGGQGVRERDAGVPDRRRPLARAVFLGVGVLLGIVTLARDQLGLTRSTARASRPTSASSYASSRANKPRQEYVASTLELDRLRELATAGLSPLVEFRAGQRQWLRAAVKLEDLDWVAEKRIECGKRFGMEMENACSYRLEVVVEPTDVGEGTIVYSRAQVHEDEAEQAERACVEFARCSAGARIGAKLPIPAGTSQPFGIRHNLQSRRPPAEWLDPDNLEREAADAEESARWNEEYATDVDAEYRVSTLSNLARYLRKKAVELRNEPAT